MNPAEIYKHFYNANSRSYLDKYYFYKIKQRVLDYSECKYAGFKVLKKKVNTNDGVELKDVFMETYWFYGIQFHIPSRTTLTGKYLGVYKKNKYKEISVDEAYLSLLWLLKRFDIFLFDKVIKESYNGKRIFNLYEDYINGKTADAELQNIGFNT